MSDDVTKRYHAGIGNECMSCKAYAGHPDPGIVIYDICDECVGIDAEDEE